MDETAIRDALAQAAECYELWRCRIVWTYLSMDGQRSIGVYAGPDADSVRRTQERTGLPVDAIWPATQHEPQPAP
jgi:hypothetical protein